MKKPTNEQWKQIMDSIKEKENQAVEIPNEFGEYMCDYFINVLPPIVWGRTYVLCSEPYSHDENGRGIYIGFFLKKKQWYGTIASKINFLEMI